MSSNPDASDGGNTLSFRVSWTLDSSCNRVRRDGDHICCRSCVDFVGKTTIHQTHVDVHHRDNPNLPILDNSASAPIHGKAIQSKHPTHTRQSGRGRLSGRPWLVERQTAVNIRVKDLMARTDHGLIRKNCEQLEAGWQRGPNVIGKVVAGVHPGSQFTHE